MSYHYGPKKRKTLSDILEARRAAQAEKQKELYRAHYLTNPRWWLVLIPTLIIGSPVFAFVGILCLVMLLGRFADRTATRIRKLVQSLTAPLLRWSQKPFEDRHA
jgi:hypothetical protein